METGIVLGLGYWGYQTGSGTLAKVVLAIVAPLVGFGFWGAVDFHQAGRAAEGLRLAQELLVSGFAGAAVWSAGQPVIGLLMAVLSIVYHASGLRDWWPPVETVAIGGRRHRSTSGTVEPSLSPQSS